MHIIFQTEEPIFLTENGEGDLVVIDIETYNRREKMLKLREELLAVEEDRIAGRNGCNLDELDTYLDEVIAEETPFGVFKPQLIYKLFHKK